MSESATADSVYYSPTLNARPSYVPADKPDPRLEKISTRILDLPLEVRSYIYQIGFSNNRVAVTSQGGCFCVTSTTGPNREEHQWLLKTVMGKVRQDAQLAFVREAFWELHCPAAFDLFVHRMQALRTITEVRHIRLNVFDTSRESWHAPLHIFGGLRSVTFSPWQKGWTIDVPARDGMEQMTDAAVMERVREALMRKDGYGFVRELMQKNRHDRGGWKLYFLFPIRYLLPEKSKGKWQLRVSVLQYIMGQG